MCEVDLAPDLLSIHPEGNPREKTRLWLLKGGSCGEFHRHTQTKGAGAAADRRPQKCGSLSTIIKRSVQKECEWSLKGRHWGLPVNALGSLTLRAARVVLVPVGQCAAQKGPSCSARQPSHPGAQQGSWLPPEHALGGTAQVRRGQVGR